MEPVQRIPRYTMMWSCASSSSPLSSLPVLYLLCNFPRLRKSPALADCRLIFAMLSSDDQVHGPSRPGEGKVARGDRNCAVDRGE